MNVKELKEKLEDFNEELEIIFNDLDNENYKLYNIFKSGDLLIFKLNGDKD